ncbi:hypothetical protein CRENBAI_012025 [Crenichthys baileyi]|uniref:Uncharacterized protein n=1 Tax=Crenichthys baileyi TaxID=28760 RepID=A0AAV9S8E7_9TELE
MSFFGGFPLDQFKQQDNRYVWPLCGAGAGQHLKLSSLEEVAYLYTKRPASHWSSVSQPCVMPETTWRLPRLASD